MRIGTHFAQQAALSDILRLQQQRFTSEQQVTTGKKAQDYGDLGAKAGALLGAKTAAQRTEGYLAASSEVAGRLDLQDAHLKGLADVAGRLRERMMNALSSGDMTGMMGEARALFAEAAGHLNARVGGQYLFGGIRSDAPPFTATALSDLANPSIPVGDHFQNSATAPKTRIDDNVTLEYGVLADAVGSDLMASFKRLAQYAPADGPLGAADRAFFENEVQALGQTIRGLNDAAAVNGEKQARLAAVRAQHEDTKVAARRLIADIEEVDLAEAVIRLNQDQVALEASYRAMRTIQQVSLLDFL